MSAEETDSEELEFPPFIQGLPSFEKEEWYTEEKPEEYFGEDWKTEPPEGKPLLPHQMKQLKNDHIRLVQFIEPVKKGGSVWEVFAQHRPRPGEHWRTKKFACKVIRPKQELFEEIGSMQTMELTVSDMRHLRRLRHPNICNMEAFIAIPDRVTGFPIATVCLFMELCDGNLGDLFTEGREVNGDNWRPPEALHQHWVRHIYKALVYIHSKEVAHKGIKAANILYICKGASDQDPYDIRFLKSTFKLSNFKLSISKEDYGYQYDYGALDDRSTLLDILYLYCVGLHPLDQVEFRKYCKTRELKPEYPKGWADNSPELLSFIYDIKEQNKYNELAFSDEQLLNHSWLKVDDSAHEMPSWLQSMDIIEESQRSEPRKFKQFPKPPEPPPLPPTDWRPNWRQTLGTEGSLDVKSAPPASQSQGIVDIPPQQRHDCRAPTESFHEFSVKQTTPRISEGVSQSPSPRRQSRLNRTRMIANISPQQLLLSSSDFMSEPRPRASARRHRKCSCNICLILILVLLIGAVLIVGRVKKFF